MPALPWKTFHTVEPTREYLVLLSELPVKSYTAFPRLLRLTFQVQQQLGRSPGLIGYSLFARLRRKQFWTLSVWEDEEALMEFVEAVPHRTVMSALRPDLGPTQFIRWAIRGDAYPPTWHGALARATVESQDETSSPA